MQHTLNGHTLIAGKRCSECYTGYLQMYTCFGTLSDHGGNASNTMMTKKCRHNIRQGVNMTNTSTNMNAIQTK